MSLNKNTGVGVALYQGEMINLDKKNVDMILKNASHSCEHLKGTKHGHIYLTNYRLIFMCTSKNDMLRELSMPFKQIKDFEIKQPVFGANFLKGKLVAEANGGWEGSVVFEIFFKDGGAIDVGQTLVKLATNPQPQLSALTMHIYNGGNIAPHPAYAAQQPFPQPAYAPQPGIPVPGSSNSYYFPSQPPAYSNPPPPPGYTPAVNPGYAPPPNGYAPPPNGYAPPPTGQPSNMSASEQAKYQESMQNSSSNLPPEYQAENPPSYNDATKKQQ